MLDARELWMLRQCEPEKMRKVDSMMAGMSRRLGLLKGKATVEKVRVCWVGRDLEYYKHMEYFCNAVNRSDCATRSRND